MANVELDNSIKCPHCGDELTHYEGFTTGGETDERWEETWYECWWCDKYFTEDELRVLEDGR